MGGPHGAVGIFVQLFQAVEGLFFPVTAEDFHGHAEAVLIRHDAAAQVEASANEVEHFVVERINFCAEFSIAASDLGSAIFFPAFV